MNISLHITIDYPDSADGEAVAYATRVARQFAATANAAKIPTAVEVVVDGEPVHWERRS